MAMYELYSSTTCKENASSVGSKGEEDGNVLVFFIV